jgi:hypothetical protein
VNTLKTAFLLAAAATTTQLDATDYKAVWDLGSGRTATAIVGVDYANGFRTNAYNFYYSGDTNSWLTRLDFTVRDSSNVEVMIRSITVVRYFFWNPNGIPIATPRTNPGFGAAGSTFFIRTFSNDYMTDPSGELSLNVPFSASVINMSYFGPNGVTDVITWMSSINGQNRISATGSTLAGLPLEGAHHRPMLSFDRMGKESQAWATGDFGSTSRTRDVHVTSGEAGINWNVGKTMLFGVAGGHAVQNADLDLGGSSATKGDFFIAELDYRPEGTQWIVSVLGMVGSWESKTNRGYDNGGSTDFSNGVADTITRSARLRVDAPAVATLGGFGFAPFASYTVTQTVVGAYTETGGGFPASFNEQEHNATEARLGVTASKDLSATTKLLLSVEGIHRFDGVGPSLTGQDGTGGVSFSLPGTAPRPDCVRFGFDVDHKLSADTLLNISAHVSTVGEAHDVSAAISIRRAF